MSGIVVYLPSGRSLFWEDAVATFAALPATGNVTGVTRLALDSGIIWYWNGAAWKTDEAAVAPGSVANTDSVNLTVTGGILTADLNLSSQSADAGFFKATSAIKSGAGNGLLVEVNLASTSQTGVITSADWNTFNGKVSPARAINTSAPLQGGGDLSADRTFSITQSGVATNGYLSSVDWNTFNNKVSATRAITTSAPLQGGGDFSADRTFSITQSGVATDGYLSTADWNTFNNKVSATRAINTTAPLTGGGDLSADRTIAIPAATSLVNGYLSSADWTTFNSKEPAIAAGTASQYWRGDKTFQTLNLAALTAKISGGAAGAGTIGEIISSTVGAASATGVGLTGVFGNVTSVVLTAGLWKISGVIATNANGAVLTTSISGGISSAANGSTLSLFDYFSDQSTYDTTQDKIQEVPELEVNISSGATYYLNTRYFYTSGSPKHYGTIKAERIG